MSVESSTEEPPTDATAGESRSRRARFREWRRNRPFAGGVLLLLAGLLIAYVPMQFAFELMLVGGSYTFIGLAWAIGVFLTGAFVLYRPDLSTIFGVMGVVLSILSLLGALGGLFIGMILGIIGGNLCVAWSRPEAEGDDRRGGPRDDDRPVRADGGTRPVDRGGPDADAEPASSSRLGGLRGFVAAAAAGPLSRLRSDDDATPRSVYLERVRRRARGRTRDVSETLLWPNSPAAPGRVARVVRSNADGPPKRLAVTLALVVAASGTLTLVSTIPAAAIVGGDEGTTYTVDVEEVQLGENGEICAASVGSDTYQVTITDATLVDATIYQEEGGDAVKTEFPTLEVEDTIVMYTNGGDDRLDLLATTIGCTDEDQTSRTVFRNHYQAGSQLSAAEGVTMLNVQAVDGAIPEPGGFQFVAPGEDNETSSADGVTGDVEGVVDGIDDVVDEAILDRLGDRSDELPVANGTVETVDGTADLVNGTAENVTDDGLDLENATDADAVDAVENTTTEATNATDDVVSSVDETVENTTGSVVGDEPPENATATVDETTDTVDETTGEVSDTTDDVTDATEDVVTNTTDEVDDANDSEVVDETTDTVDETTEETTDTVDETADDVTDGVDETTDEVVGSTEETVTSTTETATETVTATETETETETATPTPTETSVTATTESDDEDEDLPDWLDQVEDAGDEIESILTTVEETDGDLEDVENVTSETEDLTDEQIADDENLTALDNGTVLLLNGTDSETIDWGPDLPVETDVPSLSDDDTEAKEESSDDDGDTTVDDTEDADADDADAGDTDDGDADADADDSGDTLLSVAA